MIGLKEMTLDQLLSVYRVFEQAATQAKLTCTLTMKNYESWREKDFEPNMRTMVCSDSHGVLIDASWVSVAARSIKMDFRFGSQTAPATKSRTQRLVREIEGSLKENPSVTNVTEQLSSQIKQDTASRRIPAAAELQ